MKLFAIHRYANLLLLVNIRELKNYLAIKTIFGLKYSYAVKEFIVETFYWIVYHIFSLLRRTMEESLPTVLGQYDRL